MRSDLALFSAASCAALCAFDLAEASAAAWRIAFSSSLSWLTVAAPIDFFFAANARFSASIRAFSSAFARARASAACRRAASCSASRAFGSLPFDWLAIRAFISAFCLRMRSASSAFLRAFSSASFLRAAKVPPSRPASIAGPMPPFFGGGSFLRLPWLSSMAALYRPLNSSKL